MMMMYPTELWLSIITAISFLVIVIIMFCIPYIPHILARLTKTKILFMMDKGGTLKMVKAKLKGDRYQIKKDNQLFIKQYPGSYKFAGVDVDFVHADRGFVLKPEFQAAIQELDEQYGIKDYIQLKEAIDSGMIKKSDIEIPLFFTIPIDSMITYGSDVPPESLLAEVDDLYFVGKMAELNTFIKWMPYIIILAIIIIVGALAYKITTG